MTVNKGTLPRISYQLFEIGFRCGVRRRGVVWYLMFDYHVSMRGRDRFNLRSCKISQRVKGLKGKGADEREKEKTLQAEDLRYDKIHTPLLRVKDL